MLYYKDLSAVVPFYEDTLALRKTFDQDWSKIYQLTPTSFVGLIQASLICKNDTAFPASIT